MGLMSDSRRYIQRWSAAGLQRGACVCHDVSGCRGAGGDLSSVPRGRGGRL
jgi:hypothetical protein